MSNKIYTIEELRSFLNYDTYTKKVFSFSNRITIQKAISRNITGYKHYPFDSDLFMKIFKAEQTMREINWKPTEVRVVENENGIKEIKKLNTYT